MKKNRLIHRDQANNGNLSYRTMSLRIKDGIPATLNAEDRSVEVVGATEEPVEIFDWDWGIINEILLMSGLEMPKSRQVPFLDSHQRWAGTSSVLGSYREMKTEKDQLTGRVHFSSAEEAEGPYTKLREGHLTDFSVGYRQISSEWVPDGEKTTIKGRSFEGPVLITTRWRVKELSIVPVGADEQAKARSETKKKTQTKENHTMNEKLRKALEARGLSKDATEEEAWAFLERLELPKEEQKRTKKEPKTEPVDVEKIREEATGKERDRIREIDAMCTRFDYPADLADKLVVDGTAVSAARKTLIDWIAKEQENKTQHRGPVEITADERDKFKAAAVDALLIRSGTDFKPEKPAEGADDLTGYSLRELARHALHLAGKSVKGDPRKMVGRALQTSDLPYILANVANKALFAGFETNNETWPVWCSTGSVSDFKTHYSPRISESDDLEEVPESGEYQYGSRSEAQESYSIATYGKIFAITRQAIINDDLGALTRIPQSHGEAAARKIGDVAYAVLTDNAAMGDGAVLFIADPHANYVASGAVPGTDTIGAGILAMGLQTDIKGLRRLNIRPEYFIAPKTLEGLSEVFFQSIQFADSDTIATDSSLAATRKNIYGGNYFNRVYEPRLDDYDVAAWFLAARKGTTVTVFFLNGQEMPFMETKDGWTVDGVEYKVRIDCGAKAMDYRGLYLNMGN